MAPLLRLGPIPPLLIQLGDVHTFMCRTVVAMRPQLGQGAARSPPAPHSCGGVHVQLVRERAGMLAACVQGGALALGTPAHQPAPFEPIRQDCNFFEASRFCAQVCMHPLVYY